jgi:hypothetical protein
MHHYIRGSKTKRLVAAVAAHHQPLNADNDYDSRRKKSLPTNSEPTGTMLSWVE